MLLVEHFPGVYSGIFYVLEGVFKWKTVDYTIEC